MIYSVDFAERALARWGPLLFLGTLGALYGCAALPAGSRGVAYISIHLLATAIAGAVWWAAARTPAQRQPELARRILLVGLLARLVLLPAPTFTTHDPVRYLFDGRMVVEGLDPYRVAPADPQAQERLPQWAVAPEHAPYVTLYPPAALAIFAACAAAGPQLAPVLWKAVTTSVSIALCLVVAFVLWRRKRWAAITAVALNPLLIMEAGIGAHVDVLAATALVAGLALLITRGAWWKLGALLGLGVLCKLTPGVAAVPALSRSPRAVALGLGGVLAVGYGAAFALGLQPWGSTALFVERWRFGSPLIAAVEPWLGAATVPLAMGFGMAGLLLLALREREHRGSMEQLAAAMSRALGLLLALSPVVFPWYLVPLAALFPLAPTAWVALWITLHPLTYEVIDAFDAAGRWEPAGWPLVLVAAGWIGAALLHLCNRRALSAEPVDLSCGP